MEPPALGAFRYGHDPEAFRGLIQLHPSVVRQIRQRAQVIGDTPRLYPVMALQCYPAEVAPFNRDVEFLLPWALLPDFMQNPFFPAFVWH